MAQRKKSPPRPFADGTPPRAPRLGASFLCTAEFSWPEPADDFPFNVPAFQGLHRLEFHPAITFFIGENGAGKSTLLEALAVRSGFSAEGGWKRRITEDVAPSSGLDRHIDLIRREYPGDGWFLRAESFYNTATELNEINPGGYTRELGGRDLHALSHGEAFLAVLDNRLTGDGLYFFDEPEAALSPQRQLAVLALLHRLVREHSQLIIATHSPILLAYPHALIYEFSERGVQKIAYEETEHFRVTSDFLKNRERMLELLLRDEEAS